MDDLIKLATGGISSTSAMGEGVTEGKISWGKILTSAQFVVAKKAKL